MTAPFIFARIFKEPVFLRAKSHGANGKHRRQAVLDRLGTRRSGLPGIGACVQSVAESGRRPGLGLFGRDLRMPLGRAWALLDELIGQTRPFLEREGVV